MIKTNYTSHTHRCKHSKLTEEDNVKEALKHRLEEIGISEYSNLPGDDGEYRLKSMSELESYIEEVTYLKDKYKQKIKVICGLSVEIRDPFSLGINTNWIKFLYSQIGIDYLILSHNNYSDGSSVKHNKPLSRVMLEQYVADFKEAILETNIAYISHPDHLCVGYKERTKDLEWAIREMSKLSRETNTPFGINAHGFRDENWDKFGSPNKWFWKIAAQYGVKGIIEVGGYDTESWNPEWIRRAEEFAKELGIEVVERLTFQKKSGN